VSSNKNWIGIVVVVLLLCCGVAIVNVVVVRIESVEGCHLWACCWIFTPDLRADNGHILGVVAVM